MKILTDKLKGKLNTNNYKRKLKPSSGEIMNELRAC